MSFRSTWAGNTATRGAGTNRTSPRLFPRKTCCGPEGVYGKPQALLAALQTVILKNLSHNIPVFNHPAAGMIENILQQSGHGGAQTQTDAGESINQQRRGNTILEIISDTVAVKRLL